MGVGVAATGGAVASFLVRQAALDDLNRACASHQRCDPSLAPTVSRGQTASTLMMAFGAAGAAGLLGGLVLLATSGTHAASSAGLVVMPGPGAVSVAGSF